MEPSYLCFLCEGQAKLECVNKRLYVPHGDKDDCIYSAVAKEDLKKLERRDFKTISLREALAEHLSRIGEKQKALEVLA